MPTRPPSPQQIRNALQVGFAGFLAAGIHAAAGPDVNAVDGFYVVYGAARSLLPTPEASRAAAWARIVGTVFGGAVVVLLTQALHNWLAIGIGYVLIQRLGRRLGLSPATLMNAVIMTVLILAVPAHEQMGAGTSWTGPAGTCSGCCWGWPSNACSGSAHRWNDWRTVSAFCWAGSMPCWLERPTTGRRS